MLYRYSSVLHLVDIAIELPAQVCKILPIGTGLTRAPQPKRVYIMITIKDAKSLAKELILGTDIKSRATETVRATYAAHVNGDAKAEKVLVTLWETCATDKPTLAVIRAIFNRVTKKMHKELEIDKRAMVVKDGKLVEAQQRGAKGGDAGGDGDGSGDNGQSFDTTKKRDQHAIKVLASLREETNDVEQRNALALAIDALAAML